MAKETFTTLNNNSAASDPGQINLSPTKLQRLRPDLFGFGAVLDFALTFLLVRSFPHKKMIREALRGGDSRAAVVMSTEPLIVAAYTDELDCVAMLKFDSSLAADYQLKPGSKLLTVNTYWQGKVVRDLTAGPGTYGRYGNFSPMIADFLTDDAERLQTRKKQIDKAEWQRTWELGRAYLKATPDRARDGRPIFSMNPAR
ncbi:MAG: hypothetical protein QM754_20355 [Tepidisphaeraceae bacterium]